jgi:hypothetical protein
VSASYVPKRRDRKNKNKVTLPISSQTVEKIVDCFWKQRAKSPNRVLANIYSVLLKAVSLYLSIANEK